MYQIEAMVHSKQGKDTVTILQHTDNNHVIAEYNGQRYSAIFNPFVGLFYVDDLYGKLPDTEKNSATETPDNPFVGCTIVVTGKLEHFTRETINAKIMSLGAVAGRTVSKNTDYLICGENTGSKLDKARSLGIPVLSEQEFLRMAESA